MSIPTPSRQLLPVLDRARASGWVVNAMAQDRFKLTHPGASKAVITPAKTTAQTAIRHLEEQMKAALGPVAEMQTPASALISKAALKNMPPEQLRATIQSAQASLGEMKKEVLRLMSQNEGMETELRSFRMLRDGLRGLFGAGAGAAQGMARPQAGPPRQAAPGQKASAGRAPAATRAAGNKKAAGASVAQQAGGKKAAKPRAARANAKMAKTPLEKAIDATKKRDKRSAKAAESSGEAAGDLTTPGGVPITRENAGTLVKAHRAARKETQATVAQALNAAVTSLINWENGNTQPQASSLPRIAGYLNTAPEEAQPSSSLAT